MINWQGIVLHHSATKDTPGVETEGFRRFHKEIKLWQDIGYHGVIEDIDGIYEFLMGRPWYMQGAHCPGKNRTHLGICFTGNFDIYEMQEEQIITGARSIASLCSIIGAEPSDISCHRDWRDTACPGIYFPTERIIKEVEARL